MGNQLTLQDFYRHRRNLGKAGLRELYDFQIELRPGVHNDHVNLIAARYQGEDCRKFVRSFPENVVFVIHEEIL